MSSAPSLQSLWQTLQQTVLGPQGETSRQWRQSAFSHPPFLPAALQSLVDKVHRHAYLVSDQDLQDAQQAGHGQDELFELIVSAACGAATKRLEAGLAALAGAESAAGTVSGEKS